MSAPTGVQEGQGAEMLKTPETCLTDIRRKLNQFLTAVNKAPADMIRENDPRLYIAFTTLSESLNRHGKVKAMIQNRYGFRYRPKPTPKFQKYKASLKRLNGGKLSAKEREKEENNIFGMIPEVVDELVGARVEGAVLRINQHATTVGNNIRRGLSAGASKSKERTVEERTILDMVKETYVEARKTNPKPSVNGICAALLRKLEDSPFRTTDQLRNAFEYDRKYYYKID